MDSIIDSTWYRVTADTFLSNPHSTTPFYSGPNNNEDQDNDDSSEWSFTDESELVTIDLGSDKIARKAMLGLDSINPNSSDSRFTSTRAVRGLKLDDPTRKFESSVTTDESTGFGSSSRSISGSGKLFSITGLDTFSPRIKIDNIMLRGKPTQSIGSEIVLIDEYDASRVKGFQHSLRPIRSIDRNRDCDLHPTTNSSTSCIRIACVPIYDPTDNERLPLNIRQGRVPDDLMVTNTLPPPTLSKVPPSFTDPIQNTPESSASLQPLARPPNPLPSTTATAATETDHCPDSTKKSKQKQEITEQERLVRKAEKSIRKAVKASKKKDQQPTHEPSSPV